MKTKLKKHKYYNKENRIVSSFYCNKNNRRVGQDLFKGYLRVEITSRKNGPPNGIFIEIKK